MSSDELAAAAGQLVLLPPPLDSLPNEFLEVERKYFKHSSLLRAAYLIPDCGVEKHLSKVHLRIHFHDFDRIFC